MVQLNPKRPMSQSRVAAGVARVRIATWASISASLSGCVLGGGPCIHTYEDPVLVIREVRGPQGILLSPVTISGLAFAGRLVEDLAQYATPPGFNVQVVPEGLRCVVACGLGVSEGIYDLTVVALGYAPKVVRVDARYRNFDGGCPSSNSGSTEVAVVLQPAP